MNRPLLAIVASIFAVVTHAELKLATGSCSDASGKGGGTYCALASDIQGLCGKEVALDVLSTQGSFDNVQGLLRNRYSLGIVQFDVMRYFEGTDRGMTQLKVLFPLHVEEVHIITLTEPHKEGGVFGFWSKQVELQNFKDLAGRKVVAWGGSALSAEYLAFKAKVAYQLIDLSDKANPQLVAAKMLAEGKAHAILAVGGQPIGWLEDERVFGKQFKLLPIEGDIATQIGGTYDAVKLNYANLSNGQVPSLGVQALLVTQDFHTAEQARAVLTLKQCVIANRDKLRDTIGTHPKWRFIDAAGPFQAWASYAPPPGVVRPTPGTVAVIPTCQQPTVAGSSAR